ncbi:hypothetical protein PVK06_030384 [Gossypium arboreum]|uniref:Uncharacterized protein n=1 Tax=Gossypium arboreum TaxID=29729 RepID=A0ABR0NQH6_GOSAR|nr:hypothetical protein PVK06_030384 [Gossypium arboreum]
MRKMLKEITEVLTPREEVVHDVPNLDPKDPCIIINHPKLEKVLAEEINKFDWFSYEKGNKARENKTSRDMEGRKIEAIIPQKLFGVGSDLVPNDL